MFDGQGRNFVIICTSEKKLYKIFYLELEMTSIETT